MGRSTFSLVLEEKVDHPLSGAALAARFSPAADISCDDILTGT
jgi:hypothetical protein